MTHRQLLQIREQLEVGDLKVSDALLLVSRALRSKVDEKRIVWLNRELLGYRKEDLALLYERPRFGLSFLGVHRRDDGEVPAYRFLMGAWGKVDRQGKLVCVQEPRLVSKSIFCNIGIQQIETQIDEMEEPSSSLFSISADQASGAEFYCWSRELFRIYEAVREKLVSFLDEVIRELRMTAEESND
ncbi:MAG TPA: hypothetical protein V6C97_09400 [Oculatellaceae cyanobacterium]